MKALDRLLLMLYSIIVAIVSFAFLLLAIPFMPSQYENALHQLIFESKSMALIAIVLLLISVKYIFISTEFSHTGENYIMKNTEFGEIKISFSTIKSIALSSIKNINYIKEAKAQVINKDEGTTVVITTSIHKGANIPEISLSIQKNVKDTVEATTEIPINKVIVLIEETNNSSKRRVG